MSITSACVLPVTVHRALHAGHQRLWQALLCTWVVLPQPVSPAMSTTWCAAMASRIGPLCCAIGKAAREAARVTTCA